MSEKKHFIADFHIHSHYSRATSKNLTPEYLNFWASVKGITVLGSGDFTHPGWITELEEKLVEAEPGLYKLKDDIKKRFNSKLLYKFKDDTRFILTGEVSSIYKKGGKVRKVHNILFAPSFDVVKKIQYKLSQIGNIRSDGRPILGLDSKDLLDIVLNISSTAFLVPAHIWTPWFSILGSKSGFDNIKECFDDLTDYIFAIETGLSSDPAMNWRCSFLDNFSIISNSDAHSPENLGREANLFNTEVSYFSIKKALKENNNDFLGTIEFYPEEGKYHFDGHRKCNIVWSPEDSLKHNHLCPVCGKPVTLGVSYRVNELSDRISSDERTVKKPFYSVIPLKEILSEISGSSKSSKKVDEKYFSLIKKYGSELDILQSIPLDIIKHDEPVLAEALDRMKNGKIIIEAGYDGEYGVIKVFDEHEVDNLKNTFFFPENENNKTDKKKKKTISEEAKNNNIKKEIEKLKNKLSIKEELIPEINILNNSQLNAVKNINGPNLIIAGPGTGKTLTLVYRISEMIKSGIDPKTILAITFSNAAAKEIKERIIKILKNESVAVNTFHSFGLSVIRENIELLKRNNNFVIISDDEKEMILKKNLKVEKHNIKKIIDEISLIKANFINLEKIENTEIRNIFISYSKVLKEYNLFDFDDLIYIPLLLFIDNNDIIQKYKERFKFILVDEYQDINRAQYELVKLLAKDESSNITVIGDPNQSIYGFRGSDNRFIKSFSADYKNVKIYHLERSYRCTNNILSASSDIIKNNEIKTFKLSGLLNGAKISINEFGSEKSEAEFIARKIESLMGGLRFFSIDSAISSGDEDHGFYFSDFTVLTRVSSQFSPIEKAFFDHAIPYQKSEEIPYYRKEPFKRILNIINFLINKNNPFIKKEIEKAEISENEIFDLSNILASEGLHAVFKKLISKDEAYLISGFNDELNHFEELTKRFNKSYEEFMHTILTSKNTDFFKKKFDSVKLLTIHASKGLEFDNVFISGCAKLIMPFTFFENYKIDVEEEKRLMYVGMTRAKKNLFISYSNSASLFNQKIKTGKSDFINKINEELLIFNKQAKRKNDGQLSLF